MTSLYAIQILLELGNISYDNFVLLERKMLGCLKPRKMSLKIYTSDYSNQPHLDTIIIKGFGDGNNIPDDLDRFIAFEIMQFFYLVLWFYQTTKATEIQNR